MRRRTLLRTVATSGIVTLAGCSGSAGEPGAPETASPTPSAAPGRAAACTVSQSTAGVDATPVTADGTFTEAEATVALRWTARAQRTVSESEDAYIGSEADSDQKFIVFGLVVTNTAESVFTVDEYNFELAYETPDTVGTAQSAIDGIDEIDFRIKAGGTVRGGLTFLVPVDATSATLRPAIPNFPGREPIAFDPECDRSLVIGLPPL